MTAFNMRTTNRARNALLALCAAITLGATAAHADVVQTGSSGYWTAWQGPASDRAANTCAIMIYYPTTGASVGIVTSSDDQRLRVVASKNGWNIPAGTVTSLAIQVDGNPAWTQPNLAVGNKDVVMESIALVATRQFVHEITSGTNLRLAFGGTEPLWTVTLNGTAGIWPQFMNCAQMVAPAVVASLNPTQPFAAQGPSQPFSPAPPAPPSQPFNGV